MAYLEIIKEGKEEYLGLYNNGDELVNYVDRLWCYENIILHFKNKDGKYEDCGVIEYSTRNLLFLINKGKSFRDLEINALIKDYKIVDWETISQEYIDIDEDLHLYLTKE